jgi:hypothetical protein
LREQALRRWPDLVATLPTLPDEPPRLSTLAIRRRSADTVFLFDADSRPLLVLKIPHDGNPGADMEAQALREAEPAAVGPRELGRIGPARAQEALVGAPLKVEPLNPALGASLSWPAALGELAAALSRLASTTLKRGRPEQLVDLVERAIDFGGLTARTRRLVSAAARDLARLDRCVLTHRDTSPQNLLYSNRSLVGLVDWEISRSQGIPGQDMCNAALAYLEAGVGLRRWSPARVEQTFSNAWADSPFYAEARTAARDVMRAADVPEPIPDALEIGFFARRLGQRMDRPERFPTSAETAALMLNVVCGD